MARPRRTDERLVIFARRVVQQTQDIRQALAVLLPALNIWLEQTARVSGLGLATVPRLQSGFRRRRTLTREKEELEFLRPWAEQALAGGVAGRNFPTRFSSLWRQSIVNLKLASRGWRQIPKHCEA